MAKEKIVIFHHDERGAVVHWSETGELVRCKDCKHYRSVAGYIDGYCHMAEWYRRYQYPDDYCSRGERKEEC